jgi:hypothetical protein
MHDMEEKDDMFIIFIVLFLFINGYKWLFSEKDNVSQEGVIVKEKETHCEVDVGKY